MSFVIRIKNQKIADALEALNSTYESERSGRAHQAWKHGVLWVLYKLKEGMSTEEITRKAEELGVYIDC